MNMQAPFTFASIYSLGVWHSFGLHLRGVRQFQAFLASISCAESPGSSCFRSPWPVRSLRKKMRLQRGGAYQSDIRSLRARIRANGTIANLAVINITHPLSNSSVNLHINLAFEPNANYTAINASLYTVAFGNGNGTWHFNVGAIGVNLPGLLIPGGLRGDYAGLGYPFNLPNITDMNLLAAINSVSAYAGTAPVPTPVLDGLARLIITINEAIRFDVITSGINSILGNSLNYQPPAATIRGWGGHSIGS